MAIEQRDAPLPSDWRRHTSARVARRRQLRQGELIEPGLKEVVELLAADLLGEGHEVLGGCVPGVEAGGPRAQDGEERLVADTQTEGMQGQCASLVDHHRGEQVGWTRVAGARGRAGEIV